MSKKKVAEQSLAQRVTVSVPPHLRKLMRTYKKRLNLSLVASRAWSKAIRDLQSKDRRKKAG